MRSQAQVVQLNIKDGNNPGADAAYARLLDVFAKQNGLPDEIYRVADVYIDANNYDKAAQLEQTVITKWPKTNSAMNAQLGFVKIHFAKGSPKDADAALDTLIADYNNISQLPMAMLEGGRYYWEKAQAEDKKVNPLLKPGRGIPLSARPKVFTEKTKDYYTKAQVFWQRMAQDLSNASLANEAHLFTAKSYQALGQYEKAIEYYQKVVDKWPDYSQAGFCQFTVGWLYLTLQQSGKISQAEAEPKIKQAFEKLLAKYPNANSGSIKTAQRWLQDYEDAQLNPGRNNRLMWSISGVSRVNNFIKGDQQ